MKVDLEKLRALPPHTRTQISFFTAVGVAGVIALVWVTTLGGRFDAPAVITEAPKEEQKEIATEETTSKINWGVLTGKIKSQFGSVIAAWSSIRIETGGDEAEELEMSAVSEKESPKPAASAITTATTSLQSEASSTVLVGTSTVKMGQ